MADAVAVEEKTLQVVTFSIDDEWLGFPVVDVVRVEPVTRFPLTRMPRVPDVVEGIINYRGEIFPLVNGRRLLGFEGRQSEGDASVIMVSSVEERMGLVVDRVPEVRMLPLAKMEDFARRKGLRIDMEIVKCLCRDGDRLVIVLDAGALFRQVDVTKQSN